MSIPNALMQSIIDAVYVHTNRPDRIAETLLAVSKATMKMHMIGLRDARTGISSAAFYMQDVVENILSLPIQTDSHFSIDLTQYPQLRAVYQIAEWYPQSVLVANPNLIQRVYTPIEPDFLFDDYGLEKQEYWYRAGMAAQLKVLGQQNNYNDNVAKQIKFSYFAFPNVVADTYSSWIANTFPDAIIEEAAGTIFRMIGKDEEFKVYQVMTQDNISMLQSFAVTSNSF
jgi:hypothetical protein